MYTRFERLNSWSSPFLSQKVVWKHEGCSCGNDPVNVSGLASSETVFALVSVTFSSRALNRDGLVRRQGSAGEAQCRTTSGSLHWELLSSSLHT